MTRRSEAVSYGRAAGELDAVAGLIDGLALPLYYDGRMETVEEWLGWFGDDDLMRFPAIAVYGAWIRALNGSSAEAERWLSLAQRSTSTMPLSDGSATIEPWVANLRAYMMPDGVQRALADAHLALEQLAPDSFFRPSALLIRGVAHALLGATQSARTDLVAAVETANAIGAVDDAFVAHAELALLAAQQLLGARRDDMHSRRRHSSRRRASTSTPGARSRTWRWPVSRSTKADR